MKLGTARRLNKQPRTGLALGAGDAILELLTARTDWGQAMRSTSPLSGIGLISQDERRVALDAFRAHWRTHVDRPAVAA